MALGSEDLCQRRAGGDQRQRVSVERSPDRQRSRISRRPALDLELRLHLPGEWLGHAVDAERDTPRDTLAHHDEVRLELPGPREATPRTQVRVSLIHHE